jgi:carbonyl reductase 1
MIILAFPDIDTTQESPRGIGRAICNNLIRSSSHQPLKLWATSPQGTDLHLLPTNSHTEIHYPALDITSDESVKALVEEVTRARSEAGGDSKVVLINNAGVMDMHYSWQNVKRTLDVNYRGTLRVCFLPFLQSHPFYAV